ncbi:MAG: hypothetical protein LR006_03345 [Dehalococcoidia bacterium]|nr:hypothetical protein [Dehalococcoidia bacterium]
MIKVLLRNELLVLKNSYLTRSTNQILIALISFGVLLVAVGWMGERIAVIIRSVLTELGLELTMPVITTLFYVIMLWLLIASFSSIMKEARLKFYASPELSLLISSPIPVNTLFIFRFVLVTFFSVGILSFVMILPSLIAIGIVSAAPWFYYLFILPLGSLLVLISASLAILVVMLLAKVLSPKKIMLATVAFGLIGMFLWIVLITMGEEILPRLLESVMAGQLIWYLVFPLSDAARVLSGLVQGEIALLLLGRLLLACGVILSASTLAAGKLFYEGYERSQLVEIAAPKRVERQAKAPRFLGRRSNLILTEWKKAVRNYGMAQEALSPLMILFLYLFMVGGTAPPEPWDSLLLLVHIGMIGFLVSQAVATFFAPASAGQDRKALREQYSVLKAAPFVGRELILSHWLAPFVPQILLSGTILLVLNIVIGSSILIILLSLAVLALLVGAGRAFSLMIDMAAYSRQEETTNLLHRVLRIILPIVYYKLALGILAVGLVFTGVMIAISNAAFLAFVGFTSYHSLRFGAKCWEMMEI